MGEITLNYVSPDSRFRGISRALLGVLEQRAFERGNVQSQRCSEGGVVDIDPVARQHPIASRLFMLEMISAATSCRPTSERARASIRSR